MRDFTLKTYRQLLETLLSKGYTFILFRDYQSDKLLMVNVQSSINENSKIKIQNSKIVILRHDVDRLPGNALATAKLENGLGIKGTYYFRIVPESFDEKIIKQIEEMGHEIGYHYEEMDIASRQLAVGSWQSRRNFSAPTTNNPPPTIIDLAYEMFKVNLEKMRSVAEIKTICMHGSPLSEFDNKEVWRRYGYRALGIVGEPYFDIDWNEFGYLTDTGRCWNGSDVSVRDKVESKFKFNFRSTKDIIKNIDRLPDHIMITIHPQRWTNNPILWLREMIYQNVKNTVKRIIVRK